MGLLRQYFSIATGSCFILLCSMNAGWTSPYLPVLQGENSPIPLTSGEGSWFTVMSLVGCPFGAFIASFIVDKLGRKLLLACLGPIYIIGFACYGYANSFLTLCLTRAALGVCEGVVFAVLPMYISEISDAKIRGLAGTIQGVSGQLGFVFINAIGPFTSIFVSAWICAALPLVQFVAFLFAPESTYHYIKKQKLGKAEAALVALRASNDVEKELEELIIAVKRQEESGKARYSELFTVKSNRKAVFMYMILLLANKFSGIIPILFYTRHIFNEAGGDIDPIIAVQAFSIAGVLATVAASFIIDKFGRRPLMICSTLGCAITLTAESIYFTLKMYVPEYLTYIGWVPATALFMFNCVFCVGLLFGPILLLSELFPTSVKAKAMGLGEIAAVTISILSSQFFHVLTVNFGMHVPFWSFSILSYVNTFLVMKYLLETKGKTLEQIQLELLSGEKQ